jgi:hypothetical protein
MKYHVLHASLEEVIVKWMANECGGEAWISGLFPTNGEGLMATAALTVLQAIEASSKFTEECHKD